MGAFTPFMFTMAMGTSVLLLFAVGLLVVSIVSNWCVFTKAGEPGWKIFIPPRSPSTTGAPSASWTS